MLMLCLSLTLAGYTLMRMVGFRGKLCPGIAGTAACNDVIILQTVSFDQLVPRDGFGRSAFMLATKVDSWAALQQLLLRPFAINWSDEQSIPEGCLFAEAVGNYLQIGQRA